MEQQIINQIIDKTEQRQEPIWTPQSAPVQVPSRKKLWKSIAKNVSKRILYTLCWVSVFICVNIIIYLALCAFTEPSVYSSRSGELAKNWYSPSKHPYMLLGQGALTLLVVSFIGIDMIERRQRK